MALLTREGQYDDSQLTREQLNAITPASIITGPRFGDPVGTAYNDVLQPEDLAKNLNYAGMVQQPQGWSPNLGNAARRNTTALNANEQRLLGLLTDQQYLVPHRPQRGFGPAERVARTKAKRTATKAARQALFNEHIADFAQAFPGESADSLVARALGAQNRRRNIYREAHPEYYHTPTEVERRLAYTRRGKPSVMTNEKYLPLLARLQGTDTTAQVLPAHRSWVGKTPQTMNEAEYKDMIDNFADIVGTVGLRPTFDSRLLTEASAREVLGQTGYTYELEDRDADVNTPGTLKITRDAYTDANGRLVPAKVIAYGGYRFPDAKSGQTESLLKKMHYYSEVPFKNARKSIKMKDFQNRYQSVYGKPASRPTGLKIVTNYIKDILTNMNVQAPHAAYPAYVKFTRDTTQALPNGVLAFYELNPVAWNSLVSRVARIYAYYFIFPMCRVPNNNQLQRLFNEYRIKNIGNVLGENLSGALQGIINTWTNALIEPRVESVILSDYDIQDEMARVLEGIRSNYGRQNPGIISKIVSFVIGTMFNVDYRVFTRAGLLQNGGNSKTATFAANIPNGIAFTLATAQEATAIATQEEAPILSITPLRNDKLEANYKGVEYIEPDGPEMPSGYAAPNLPPITDDEIETLRQEAITRGYLGPTSSAPQ